MSYKESDCTASLAQESDNIDSRTLDNQENSSLASLLRGWDHSTNTNILIKKYNIASTQTFQPPILSATPQLNKSLRFTEKNNYNLKIPHRSVSNHLGSRKKTNSSIKFLSTYLNTIRKKEILKTCERNGGRKSEAHGDLLRKNMIIHSIFPEKFRLRENIELGKSFLKHKKDSKALIKISAESLSYKKN